MDNTQNPLLQYSRRESVWVPLPSQGYFNHPDDVHLSVNGELGVAPMTTNDELLLKNPEGLLNGESILKVMESCCPGIKNIRNLPAPDMDVILMAIRQASYGDYMEFDVKCPNCDHEATYVFSLSTALNAIQLLDPEYYIGLSSGLTVYVKPYTIELALADALNKFNESKTMRDIAIEDLVNDKEKAKHFGEVINKLASTVLSLTSQSVVKIVDPNGNDIDVSSDQISEWMSTLPRSDAKLITDKINTINTAVINKDQELECPECGHKWTSQVNFDPTHFFDTSS